MELAAIFGKNNIMTDLQVKNEIFILEYTVKKEGIFSRDILIISFEEIESMKLRSNKNIQLDTLIVSFSQKMTISQDLIDYLNILGVKYTTQNFKITSGLYFYAIGYKDIIFSKEAILVLYLLGTSSKDKCKTTSQSNVVLTATSQSNVVLTATSQSNVVLTNTSSNKSLNKIDNYSIPELFQNPQTFFSGEGNKEIIPSPPSCPKIISPNKNKNKKHIPRKAMNKISSKNLGTHNNVNIVKRSSANKNHQISQFSLPNNSNMIHAKKKKFKKSNSTPEKINEL